MKGESTPTGSDAWSSKVDARLWTTTHARRATAGSSPRVLSTASHAGATNFCAGSGCSMTFPTAQPAVSRTMGWGSVAKMERSPGTKESTKVLSSAAAAADASTAPGASRTEPNAVRAASRVRQLAWSTMFLETKGRTKGRTPAAGTSARSARHAPAAVALFHESSSWNSSCWTRHSKRTGQRCGTALGMKFFGSLSSGTGAAPAESATSSWRLSSSSETELQNSMAWRATSSRSPRMAVTEISKRWGR
mmetsp:Transcript_11908/g.31471  ORF Transcript_11908/g.31471 Transcript_11908/m.31471 type:complete len:249 (+) Transcript_11908:1798-2544(+)